MKGDAFTLQKTYFEIKTLSIKKILLQFLQHFITVRQMFFPHIILNLTMTYHLSDQFLFRTISFENRIHDRGWTDGHHIQIIQLYNITSKKNSKNLVQPGYLG